MGSRRRAITGVGIRASGFLFESGGFPFLLAV
jgi:hypothetical protein